jgi:hypothetical protein
MSLVNLALLPIRVGLGVADAVLQAVTPPSPAPPSELVVVDGMPEGVPVFGGFADDLNEFGQGEPE